MTGLRTMHVVHTIPTASFCSQIRAVFHGHSPLSNRTVAKLTLGSCFNVQVSGAERAKPDKGVREKRIESRNGLIRGGVDQSKLLRMRLQKHQSASVTHKVQS
jgi:hypothetical protein